MPNELKALLENARAKALPECMQEGEQACPCRDNDVAFGWSCLDPNPKHAFFDWRKGDEGILTFLALQDPGAGGPVANGVLCGPCNAINGPGNGQGDMTATNERALWNAVFGKDAETYRESLYLTNAVMHGCNTLTGPQITTARNACRPVLVRQWEIAQPKVTVVASWAKNAFPRRFFQRNGWENVAEAPAGMIAWSRGDQIVIKTYHLSNQAIYGRNGAASHYRLDTLNGVKLTEEMERLLNFNPYGMPRALRNKQGMSVLLRHWIFIADEVRKAAKALKPS